MKLSDKGLSLIEEFEGVELKAYLDIGKVLTIGYGHTKNVKEGMVITKEEARELLKQDVEYFENQVLELVKVPITQGIFDALVSFVFNVGENAFANSTLLRFLNQGFYAKAGDQLLKWCKVNGKEILGLKRRREAERKLFYSQPFPKV